MQPAQLLESFLLVPSAIISITNQILLNEFYSTLDGIRQINAERLRFAPETMV